MNPSLERELLRLQLKSDAELARLIRKAEAQGRLYLACGAVVVMVLAVSVMLP
jgi:hypothetical protein